MGKLGHLPRTSHGLGKNEYALVITAGLTNDLIMHNFKTVHINGKKFCYARFAVIKRRLAVVTAMVSAMVSAMASALASLNDLKMQLR